VIVAPQSDGRPDGTALRDALWNLALLLNVPGQERGGWLEYQPNGNSRGASDMGLRPDTLPGYVAVGDAAGGRLSKQLGAARCRRSRAATSRPCWPTPGNSAPCSHRFRCGFRRGHAVAGDPQPVAQPVPQRRDPPDVRADLGRAPRRARAVPFVVVTELFCSETAKLADVVLPATCFAERDGTYVNLEGRAQFAPAAVRPILGVRSDRAILNTLGEALAQRLGKAWASQDAAATLSEINALVPGYAAATRAALDGGEGVLVKATPADGKFGFTPLA